jgi:hypothetical protein
LRVRLTAQACCSAGIAWAARSRSRRRHRAELPQRRQIVNDPTLPEDPAVTDLENHDLVELRALPGGWQRPPLAVLCSRDGQMDHDAIAFGDEFVNLLVVVRERCPSAFDHGADALVSFAKGIRAIVPHEIRRLELGDRIKAPAVPDDGGDLVDQPLVLLAHQLLRSARRRTMII